MWQSKSYILSRERQREGWDEMRWDEINWCHMKYCTGLCSWRRKVVLEICFTQVNVLCVHWDGLKWLLMVIARKMIIHHAETFLLIGSPFSLSLSHSLPLYLTLHLSPVTLLKEQVSNDTFTKWTCEREIERTVRGKGKRALSGSLSNASLSLVTFVKLFTNNDIRMSSLLRVSSHCRLHTTARVSLDVA